MPDQPPPIPQSTYIPDAPRSPMPPQYPGPLGGNIQPHRGSLIVGLSIASIVVFVTGGGGLIFPPCCLGSSAISIALAVPAWVMANVDARAMREGRMDPSGRGMVDAGRTIAIIAVILNGLGLLGCLGSVAWFGLHGLTGGRSWRGFHP
jgi:hypothetical protein